MYKYIEIDCGNKCLNFVNRSMDQKINSDINSKMVAKQTFNNILELIQTSNLNFQLQISPFSASISLKKTLVKDKFGVELLPSPTCLQPTSSPEYAALIAQNKKLESDLFSLTQSHEKVVDDCASAYRKIDFLQTQLHEKIMIRSEDFTFNEEILRLEKKNERLEKVIDNQKEEIESLHASNKNLSKVSGNLNKELNQAKLKFQKEKKSIFKQHRTEIKSWRKELGEEIKLKIKLEEKLEKAFENAPDLLASPPANTLNHLSPILATLQPTQVPPDTLCSICANSILNYIPEYFLDEEINPACFGCKDSASFSDEICSKPNSVEETPPKRSLKSTIEPFTPKGFTNRPSNPTNPSLASSKCSHVQQCIIQEPFPPPLPAMIPIVNMYSLYHIKAMAGELDWGSTCSYCMRIEYEKYGCESCVWIKCYGELHGYPDVDPYDFKKYL
jgi:hypothetical protein